MDLFQLEMKVNGEAVSVPVNPGLRLLDVLRDVLHLSGTKEGCGEGECGACSVIIDGELVDSCLVLAPQAHNREIITIEGISADGELDTLQSAFLEAGAVQCGYCTPGMILAAKVLLSKNPKPGRQDIARGIAGNLCRCTGYAKIIKAVELAAAGLQQKEGEAGV